MSAASNKQKERRGIKDTKFLSFQDDENIADMIGSTQFPVEFMNITLHYALVDIKKHSIHDSQLLKNSKYKPEVPSPLL